LEAIQVSGKQADITEAWLQGWWLTPAAVLHRRKAISRIGGWDESLKAAQDADLMIRLSLAGSHFKYQRGAYAIYRKHGDDRVSSNPIRWRENRYRVLEKALDTLTHSNRLTPTYCHALAISYYRLARHWLNSDREKHDQLISRVLQLKPNIQSTGRALIRQYLSATD
jgi:GT2 family glycosyltransferase